VGDRRALVLVHGLSGSRRWWERVVPALALRFDVHLVDLPGFGSVRSRGFRLAEADAWLADRVAAHAPAHVVGHSMGGLVAARVAARRPELVDRLVLVAPAGVPVGRSIVGHARPLLAALRAVPPRQRLLLAADAARAGPLTLLRAGLDVAADDVRTELERLRADTLVVWGENDRLLPPALAGEWRDALPHARIELLRRCGHVPMWDAPDELARLLVGFLEEERPRE
jgi:pimeloyl-ACP methyl ester carboxylesterase